MTGINTELKKARKSLNQVTNGGSNHKTIDLKKESKKQDFVNNFNSIPSVIHFNDDERILPDDFYLEKDKTYFFNGKKTRLHLGGTVKDFKRQYFDKYKLTIKEIRICNRKSDPTGDTADSDKRSYAKVFQGFNYYFTKHKKVPFIKQQLSRIGLDISRIKRHILDSPKREKNWEEVKDLIKEIIEFEYRDERLKVTLANLGAKFGINKEIGEPTEEPGQDNSNGFYIIEFDNEITVKSANENKVKEAVSRYPMGSICSSISQFEKGMLLILKGEIVKPKISL